MWPPKLSLGRSCAQTEQESTNTPMNNPCPLCDANAFYQQGHTYRHYTCPTCTDFYIDEVAEEGLAELVEVFRTEFRKKLSNAVKTRPPGTRYLIREADPVDRSKPHIETNTPMITAYPEAISIDGLR